MGRAQKALDSHMVEKVPRTTEKTLRAQQHVQRILQERREQERQEQFEIQKAQVRGAQSDLRYRIREAVGKIEPLEDKINRIVADKRHTSNRVEREKRRELENIQKNIKPRPLLMDATDSLARARRRALFRVRDTLQSAGLDIDKHFNDNELDDMENEAWRARP